MNRTDRSGLFGVARRTAALGVTGALLLTTTSLTSCGADSTSSAASATTPPAAQTPTTPAKTRLQEAAGRCATPSSLADEGVSISFDTEGEEDTSGDDFTLVACVLGELNVPNYVVEHMDSTRALDGTQEDEWDGFKARWTYHPDAGIQLTVIDTTLTQ